MTLSNRAAIVGIGATEFSKESGRSELQLAVEAIGHALRDCGIAPSEVDGLTTFTMDNNSEIAVAREALARAQAPELEDDAFVLVPPLEDEAPKPHEADAALEAIWADLATMAPVALRRDLDVVSLFDAPDQGDDVTLAFVTAMDDAGTRFQMAFNAAASDEDPDELLLTTAHEFSHVFTATPDELDRVIQPEACRTYDNGEGCYRDGARMLDWIAAFWSDDQLADVGTADDPDVADGEERCAADAGFLGPYAATTPEEDFAESFSAFVLDVEPATPGQAERLAWFAEDPELAEVRDRARAAGLGPLPNTFATCG